jgi:hypothetical protein
MRASSSFFEILVSASAAYRDDEPHPIGGKEKGGQRKEGRKEGRKGIKRRKCDQVEWYLRLVFVARKKKS